MCKENTYMDAEAEIEKAETAGSDDSRECHSADSIACAVCETGAP